MLRKVLIVDDSMMIHQMYRILLMRYEDCELIGAVEGDEGLRLLDACDDIDLVLLDMNMPGMNGCDFLARMKEREIPVIIISARSREECELEGLTHKIKGFINKRFAAEGIHEIIREIFPDAAQGAVSPSRA